MKKQSAVSTLPLNIVVNFNSDASKNMLRFTAEDAKGAEEDKRKNNEPGSKHIYPLTKLRICQIRAGADC
jgi:hypothetical protein